MVIDRINDLSDALGSWDPTEIEPALEAAKTQIDKSIKALKELGGFDGDTKFVDACLELFKMFKRQLNDEYKEQLEIYKLPVDQYTKAHEDRFNELNDILDAEYYPAFEKFSAAQDYFADFWGFDLE